MRSDRQESEIVGNHEYFERLANNLLKKFNCVNLRILKQRLSLLSTLLKHSISDSLMCFNIGPPLMINQIKA